MIKKLFLASIMMLGLFFVSSCKDDDNGTNEQPQNAGLYRSFIEDDICGVYIDTTNINNTRAYMVLEALKDGRLNIYLRENLDCDGEVEQYCVNMHWNLSEKPLYSEEGKEFYEMNISIDWAENGITREMLDGSEYANMPLVATIATIGASVNKEGNIDYFSKNEGDGQTRSWISDAWDSFSSGFVKVAKTVGNVALDGLQGTLVVIEEIDGILTADDKILYDKIIGSQEYGNWMSKIDGRIPLCKLCIPGTHDTFTYESNASRLWARTQIYNIEQQWNLGVRCFDMRLSYLVAPDDFYLSHGGILMSKSFDTAIKEIRSLLSKNNQETAIIVVKIETCDGPESEAIKKLDTLIKGKWNMVMWTPNMTLEDARGKILVMARYGADTSTNKNVVAVKNWGDYTYNAKLENSNGSTPLFIQDEYSRGSKSDSDYVTYKKNVIDELLERVSNLAWDDYTWSLNHTSGFVGAVLTMNYPGLTEQSNPHMEKAIKSDKMKGKSTGIIVMDFAGFSYPISGGINLDMFAGNNPQGRTLPETIVTHNYDCTWNGIPYKK